MGGNLVKTLTCRYIMIQSTVDKTRSATYREREQTALRGRIKITKIDHCITYRYSFQAMYPILRN